MAGDDYSVAGGGGLRLKGAKIKKKKRRDKDGGGKTADKVKELDKALSAEERDNKRRRSEEKEEEEEATDDFAPSRLKTEAERRFEEAKRKKLLEMAESAATKPDLLKTHKERVEELNTYLSKLSEHHDMPKIGPG